MNILDYLKSALSTNWPTMVVLSIVWWNLNTKMNEVLIGLSTNSVRIESNSERINKTEKRLDLIESKIFAYIGTARKEDEEDIN